VPTACRNLLVPPERPSRSCSQPVSSQSSRQAGIVSDRRRRMHPATAAGAAVNMRAAILSRRDVLAEHYAATAMMFFLVPRTTAPILISPARVVHAGRYRAAAAGATVHMWTAVLGCRDILAEHHTAAAMVFFLVARATASVLVNPALRIPAAAGSRARYELTAIAVLADHLL